MNDDEEPDESPLSRPKTSEDKSRKGGGISVSGRLVVPAVWGVKVPRTEEVHIFA